MRACDKLVITWKGDTITCKLRKYVIYTMLCKLTLRRTNKAKVNHHKNKVYFTNFTLGSSVRVVPSICWAILGQW